MGGHGSGVRAGAFGRSGRLPSRGAGAGAEAEALGLVRALGEASLTRRRIEKLAEQH